MEILQSELRFPLVSIIIPCWNAEHYVGEAIQSALDQTYPKREVIVIDDGSTDRSLDVINTFGDRIRWETGPNRGGCAARNRGLLLAKGELIQFLDADDLLFPDKLKIMVPIAIEYGPGVAGICDWECINNERSPEPEVHRLHYNEEDPVLFCLSKQLQTSSPLHWKCDLEAVGGFDESLPCSQERDLHLRLVCNGIRFVYLPEALYRVMRRRNSVSDDYRNVLLQHGRIFERAFRNLKVKGELTDQRAYWFAKAVAKDGRHCMQHSLTSTAKEYFRLSKSMHRDGILHAFGRRELRVVARLVGPAVAESLCQIALRLGVRV